MSSPGPRLRVLIADDSPIVRAFVRHALEGGGIEVVAEAPDGAEALRLFALTTPEVLVIDLDMPQLSGLDVITRVMAERPVPILVLTARSAYSEVDQCRRALELGAQDVLLKSAGWNAETAQALCDRVRALARAGVRRAGATGP